MKNSQVVKLHRLRIKGTHQQPLRHGKIATSPLRGQLRRSPRHPIFKM